METLETKKNTKKVKKYVCEKCCFETALKSNYERHLLTRKHKNPIIQEKKNKKNKKNKMNEMNLEYIVRNIL